MYTVKDASPAPEGGDAESGEAQPEKEGSPSEAVGDEGNEVKMTGVVEGEEGEGEEGEGEGMEGGEEEKEEGDRKKPVEETGEQAQSRSVKPL